MATYAVGDIQGCFDSFRILLDACGFDPAQDTVLMVEVRAEAVYVKKHKQKIAFVLAAMRHFAELLRLAGFRVDYVDFEDPANSGDFTGEVARIDLKSGQVEGHDLVAA